MPAAQLGQALFCARRSLRRTRRATLAVLAAVALLSLACGRGPSSSPAAGTATNEASTPQRGGTLVTGMSSDMVSVNPYLGFASAVTSEVAHLLFLRLLDEQPDFEEHPPTLKPALAERWETSPDGKTVTFYLRPGARWSDGVPVTAEDVRFTWEAQTSPEVAWDSAYFKDMIEDVEVVDATTVRFHLKAQTSGQLLWINEGEILPKHVWSALPFEKWSSNADWFRQHLVVDGPYTLTSWSPQQEIVLGRNDAYFDAPRPYIDRIVIRVVPDAAALTTQLLAGEVDLYAGLLLKDVARVEADPKLRLVSTWSRSHAFVAWNLRKAPFDDPVVRRALTMAIDRQALVEAVYGRYGKQAVSPVLSSTWPFDRSLKPIPYDPEGAKRLLAERGWADHDGDGVLDREGRKLAFDLETNTGNQIRNDSVVIIQSQLREIGVAAQARLTAFNVLMERANRGDFDAILMRWSIPTDFDLTFAYHSKSIGASNVFGYRNPEVDRLLDEARLLPTFEQLGQALVAIQRQIATDQPATFLYESQDLIGIARRVKDAKPNLLRRLWHAWEWWLEPAGAG